MSKYTRGEFFGLSAALAAGHGLGRAGAESPRTQSASGPDLIVHNAVVYTVDEGQPRAQALAVKNSRFIAVGSDEDVRGLATDDTQILDAEGMTVVPGFIDAHSHPASGGLRELTSVNLDLRSIIQIQNALRQRAATTPRGEWVTGFKYDDTKVVEGRRLTIADLDQAVPEHPVRVSHRGGHTSWYNSMAFEMAGVNSATPDPTGGRFERRDGMLTGMVAERANGVFSRLIPGNTTREERQAGVALISEMVTAAGLTSVHDAGCGTSSAIAYQDARDAGQLRMRVYMMVRGGIFNGLKTAGISTGFGDEWLRVGGVKFGADGSASERTMAMSTPYIGRPDDYGILTMSQGLAPDRDALRRWCLFGRYDGPTGASATARRHQFREG